MNKEYTDNKINTRLYLFALLITNIGNSASFIICGKYSYDYFGLASIFGALLIIESIQSILFSGMAGYLTDRIGSQKISVLCDMLLFIIVLAGGILASNNLKNWSVIFVYFIMNLVKPFQNTAIFALAKNVAKTDDDLYRLNSKSGMFFQMGYLIGLGITGFYIKQLSLSAIMVFDSLTFLFSGFLIFSIKANVQSEKKLQPEAYKLLGLTNIKNQYFEIIKKNKRIFFLCIIIGIQINLIIAYNTNLFKFVAENLGNKAFNLSILEAAYTIVCILVGWILSRENFIQIKNNVLFYFLILQSIVFALIPNTINIYYATVLALLFGLVSSVIFPSLFSSLYKCVQGADAGKLGGIKSMLQSLIAVPILLFNSFLVDKFKLEYGYWLLSFSSIVGCYLVYIIFNKSDETAMLT